MRTLLVGLGILACATAALSADGRQTAPPKGLRLAPPILQALRAGFPPAAVRGLQRPLTAQQQLRSLQGNPVTSVALQKLGITSVNVVMGGDPWGSGVTVSPLAPIYPAGSGPTNFQAALQSRAIWLSPYSPLPTQASPLMWLSVGANYDPLFWVEITWPSTGVYMITFMMKDLLPTSIARPRVFKNGSGYQDPVPNNPTGGDTWTLLWEAKDPKALHEDIGVYPSESGFGFTFCCLSKVMFTKLK